MNFYSYWKAERSPGLESSRHSIKMTLYSDLQQIQHILNYLQKLRESIARSGGKGILLKR